MIVVGAGTGRMVAAISAAKQGARVLLIEKNKKAGKKLLMTGSDWYSVASNRPVDDLIAHIPGNGNFLYNTFAQWNSLDIMDFFKSQNVHLKEEDHGRMFPMTNKSKTIIETLLNRLKELDVTILFPTRVEELVHKGHKIYGICTELEEFHAPAVILAIGGRIYPSTDSTGDGYEIVKRVGHTVMPLYTTESSLISNEPYIQEKILQRLSLQDITLRVLDKKGRVLTEHTTDLLFTHFGISDPAALHCSGFIDKELKKTGESVTLSLDCFPTQTKQEFIHLLTEKNKATKKNLVNVWHGLLPERLLVFFLERLEMDSLAGRQASQKKIQDFVQLYEEFELSINKTFPIEEPFVIGGGVSLREIHPKTLGSKIIDGLYFTGELLDVDGYIGGFDITTAFATEHVAGRNTG